MTPDQPKAKVARHCRNAMDWVHGSTWGGITAGIICLPWVVVAVLCMSAWMILDEQPPDGGW